MALTAKNMPYKDGFAPFGQVVSGMDVVDKVFAYPREKEPDQRRLLREGNEYLKEFTGR